MEVASCHYSLSPALPEDESVLDLLEAHLELPPVQARVAVREHLVRHQLKVVGPEKGKKRSITHFFTFCNDKTILQGDTSGCSPGFADIKAKVRVFETSPGLHIR